jgi:sulfite reductase (ferredoxin)
MTDCGQAMFNDIGVVAVSRPLPDGTTEAGFRVFIAGGLGANPHPAKALEEFTPREQLLATLEAVLRTFDHYGNRDNKLRARLKWLVDTMGIDELRERILKERKLLLASSSWPGGIPAVVQELGDAPAGVAAAISPTAVGTPVSLRLGPGDPYKRWEAANVVIGVTKGTVSAVAYARLGDVTSVQFRALAAVQRDLGASLRVTNRQNVVFRDLSAEQLPELYRRLETIGMAEPGAELARDVVGRFADERRAGEEFSRWLERAGGAKAVGSDLSDLDNWPSPEVRPDYYIDFDETGPYVAEVGMGECAGA